MLIVFDGAGIVCLVNEKIIICVSPDGAVVPQESGRVVYKGLFLTLKLLLFWTQPPHWSCTIKLRDKIITLWKLDGKKHSYESLIQNECALLEEKNGSSGRCLKTEISNLALAVLFSIHFYNYRISLRLSEDLFFLFTDIFLQTRNKEYCKEILFQSVPTEASEEKYSQEKKVSRVWISLCVNIITV